MKVPAKFAKLMKAADRRFVRLGIKATDVRMTILECLAGGHVVIRQRNPADMKSYGRWMVSKPDTKWRKVVRELGRPWK